MAAKDRKERKEKASTREFNIFNLKFSLRSLCSFAANRFDLSYPELLRMLDAEPRMERFHSKGNSPVADYHHDHGDQGVPGELLAAPAEGYP